MTATSKTGLLAIKCFGLLLVLLTPGALQAQGQNGITEPAEGETVSGIAIINGTAFDPNFLRYELAFRHTTSPEWIVFFQGDQTVSEGTLAIWDTTVGRETNPIFPDGIYQLRLRVVRTDYNYAEFFLTNIIVSNDEPTPTETPTTDEITPSPVADEGFLGTSQPANVILPSLTPFPTPLPRATPIDAIPVSGEGSGQEADEESGGIIGQLFSVDTSSLGRAFWRGVFLVALVFAGLAVYLLFRGGFRRLWRIVQAKIFR